MSNDALKQLRNVAAIWKRLDEAVAVCEAQTRMLLATIQPLNLLTKLPDWVTDQCNAVIATCYEEGDPIDISVVDTAKKCISAFLPSTCYKLTAVIEDGPLGSIVVDWNVGDNRLQWMVRDADLPWPGIEVSVLSRKGGDENVVRTTHLFHDVFGLIEYSLEQISIFFNK